ncbi:PglL family O-oligosaccharyltransferase [Paucibacter soli]|uniref:PglL family O-oligosaccharyltransferase n=1 Tax=Paucibacter soli TaxID=3133433 RepID=UPI003098F368
MSDVTSFPPLQQHSSVDRGLALLACAFPLLLAYNLTPSATLFNQLLALGGWGALLLYLSLQVPLARARMPAAAWGLLLMLLAALSSPLLNGLPWSLALSGAALLGAALAVLVAAQALAPEQRMGWFLAFMWALLLAGLVSALISLVQVFMPDWADGNWIARSGIPGRAVGNMRQPNHLASLLIWACVAAVALAQPLGQRRRPALSPAVLSAILLLLVLAIVLSASRTGMLAVLLLAAWGALDRRLTRASRFALLATPLMLALHWALLSAWASLGSHAFGAETRLAEGAGSPSRMAILRNAWALLQQQALTGVGWGEFNLAWTMSPFPDRPVAFFDHCHNLPMQLLVELGWPLGLAVLGLLICSCWVAWRESCRAGAQEEEALMRRCAFMVVAMIGLHSLLEYPLWYSYFLLPTAFALGFCLAPQMRVPTAPTATRVSLAVAGGVLLLGSLWAVYDYLQVVAVYAPPAQAEALEQRIARAQRSVFFSAQADYAAATSSPPSEAALAATRRTAHNLIDVRLMMAWAKSLHAVGETDQARHVAQRLREFRSAQGAEWLEVCDQPPMAGERPFQCTPPQRAYDWRELR